MGLMDLFLSLAGIVGGFAGLLFNGLNVANKIWWKVRMKLKLKGKEDVSMVATLVKLEKKLEVQVEANRCMLVTLSELEKKLEDQVEANCIHIEAMEANSARVNELECKIVALDRRE